MKKFLLLGILSIMVVGCTNAPTKIELSPTEISQLGGDKNKGAEILIRRAVLKEMSQYKYSETDAKALKDAKENLEIEFFLNNISSKKVSVSDEEALALYNANKESLKGIKAEVALPQIKEQLLLQRVNAEKVNYINSLVEKYNLNEKFKTYFPTQEAQQVEESVK